MDYLEKYQKYKDKYYELKLSQQGGAKKSKKKDKKKSIKKSNKNKMKRSEISLKPKYELPLSEPWFTLISLGLKTVEGRKNSGRFKEMQVGDLVTWTNEDFKSRCVLTRITRKKEYKTFKEYLETEGLQVCLPGMPDIERGLSVYFKYYTPEDEAKNGVIAIGLEVVK
jgi:ASC-1-like (ASCH) protein